MYSAGAKLLVLVLFGLLERRTPWSVGMYLKKGGISRYSYKLRRN